VITVSGNDTWFGKVERERPIHEGFNFVVLDSQQPLPKRVSDVKVSNDKGNSYELSWSPVEGAVRYVVQFSRMEEKQSEDSTVINYSKHKIEEKTTDQHTILWRDTFPTRFPVYYRISAFNENRNMMPWTGWEPIQPETDAVEPLIPSEDRTREGFSVEIQGGPCLRTVGMFGFSVRGGVLYQFNNLFGFGISGGVHQFLSTSSTTEPVSYSAPNISAKIVFGNKFDGFAYSVDLGVSIMENKSIPIAMMGIYFKNFFFNLMPPFLIFNLDSYAVLAEFGYSIYLGK
jgi:hypothetical protein